MCFAFCHLCKLRSLPMGCALVLVLLNDELGVLRRCAGVLPALRFWEVLGQEPEGDASQDTDHPSYQVPQPPRSHPLHILGTYRDAVWRKQKTRNK